VAPAVRVCPAFVFPALPTSCSSQREIQDAGDARGSGKWGRKFLNGSSCASQILFELLEADQRVLVGGVLR